MKKFKSGDLIQTITFKGKTIYGIVVSSTKRFQYEELKVLVESKITGIIYDERKETVKLIQRCKDKSFNS